MTSTVNQHLKAAVSAVRSLDSKSNSLWKSLALFAYDYRHQNHEQLKDTFRQQQRLVEVETRVDLNANSTFRVQKGLLVQAREFGVSIIDSDGKPRSKSDVQADVTAAKGEGGAKDPTTVFAERLASAAKASEKLTDADCVAAAAQVLTLLQSLEKRMPASVVGLSKAA